MIIVKHFMFLHILNSITSHYYFHCFKQSALICLIIYPTVCFFLHSCAFGLTCQSLEGPLRLLQSKSADLQSPSTSIFLVTPLLCLHFWKYFGGYASIYSRYDLCLSTLRMLLLTSKTVEKLSHHSDTAPLKTMHGFFFFPLTSLRTGAGECLNFFCYT